MRNIASCFYLEGRQRRFTSLLETMVLRHSLDLLFEQTLGIGIRPGCRGLLLVQMQPSLRSWVRFAANFAPNGGHPSICFIAPADRPSTWRCSFSRWKSQQTSSSRLQSTLECKHVIRVWERFQSFRAVQEVILWPGLHGNFALE
eukprot:4131959-Amphidinium_carterae.1